MERLMLLCLLSPAIFARPHKSKDPNDEPFLPIHPVYPYSPKLIKRGTEGEVNPQLTSELYAPKVDAKDTYSASYSSNYQRDSYYPDYNPYLTNGTPSFAYPSYYSGGGGEAYVYVNTPYPAYNSYPVPYAAVNPASYPNYYHQPPYYYPHYFNHALFPPPPPSPPGVGYHEASQLPAAEDSRLDADNKKDERAKDDRTAGQEAPVGQFVDGNYIAGNSRDLDVQSSTYKVAGPYNQLVRDVQVKNLPISLPAYRVVSVGEQPVSPDYQLPPVYVKAQQIEQMTSQALADLLAQNARQQSARAYENNRDTLNGAGGGSYVHQDAYDPNAQPYATFPGVRGKPAAGVAYVIDSAVGVAKVNGEQDTKTRQGGSTSQVAPQDKGTKYSSTRKPASRSHPQGASYVVSPESRGNHRARVSSGRPAGQTDKYGGYEAPQSYVGAYSQADNKQEPNYGAYQSGGSYQSEGFTGAPQTPRSPGYQYAAYETDQAQQPRQDETNADDGNFGTKHKG